MGRPSTHRAHGRERRARRALAAALAALAVAGPVAGCGGPSGPLDGERLVVSSTATTEQIVLGQLTIERLRSAGADVVDQTNVRGSALVRDALQDGDVDVAWSTTGVAWRNDLGHARSVGPPARQLELVRREDLRRNGIAWIAPARYDSGYALAVGRGSRDREATTVSGLLAAARERGGPVRLCADRRFARSAEGLPAIRRAYRLAPGDVDVALVEPGEVYASARAGRSCDAGAVFATDPRVRQEGLRVLRDDRAALTSYRPAVTVRASTLREAPALRTVLEPLAAALTGDEIRRLVSSVESGNAVDRVTRDWLARRGLA